MDSQQLLKPKAGDFNGFLANVELGNIRTIRLDVRAEKEFQLSTANDINVGFKSSYVNNDAGDGFTVDVAYLIRLRAGKRILGSVAATFRLYYSSPQPMTDPFFVVFGKQPVQFVTWPFLRQTLSDVASRCNWPRLTLPTMHVQIDDGKPSGDSKKKKPTPKGRPRKKPLKKVNPQTTPAP